MFVSIMRERQREGNGEGGKEREMREYVYVIMYRAIQVIYSDVSLNPKIFLYRLGTSLKGTDNVY